MEDGSCQRRSRASRGPSQRWACTHTISGRGVSTQAYQRQGCRGVARLCGIHDGRLTALRKQRGRQDSTGHDIADKHPRERPVDWYWHAAHLADPNAQSARRWCRGPSTLGRLSRQHHSRATGGALTFPLASMLAPRRASSAARAVCPPAAAAMSGVTSQHQPESSTTWLVCACRTEYQRAPIAMGLASTGKPLACVRARTAAAGLSPNRWIRGVPHGQGLPLLLLHHRETREQLLRGSWPWEPGSKLRSGVGPAPPQQHEGYLRALCQPAQHREAGRRAKPREIGTLGRAVRHEQVRRRFHSRGTRGHIFL